MQVKVNDLSQHIKPFAEQIKQKLSEVVDSSWFLLGNETKSLEENFAAYIGVKYCRAVANGTDALELGLRAIGVEAKTKVITVANAGAYSTIALNLIGAIPVYVDVDEEMNMCPSSLEKALANHKDIQAVVVTHLYGNIAQIDKISSLCEKYSIPLLEDCAQAHGASLDSKKAGSWGDIASFSFYPTKNLGAIGDAGAIVSSNEEYINKAKTLSQYGWSKKYVIDTAYGRNSRIDEMQAIVLNVFLKEIDSWNQKRSAIGQKYCEAFKDLPLGLPANKGEGSVFHLFIIRTKDRDKLSAYLAENDVQTDIHYPVPDHMQSIMSELGFYKEDLTNTENYANEILTLPCYPELSDDKVDYVIKKVKSFYA